MQMDPGARGKINMPADQGRTRRSAALERHVLEFDPGLLGEELDGQLI
jgi:hypothetical protein